jgi:hypothetical protein
MSNRDPKESANQPHEASPMPDALSLSDTDLDAVAGGVAATRCAVENDGKYYVHESYYLDALA